eukprot:TRINITY_DN73145_c0_g1_i1.p1 TRINITY_DN73145_c0_g1~~TRINITY_DN73145_c0_g1_i1.p1  ORF type:complete len:284 (-),score=28.79 TRINITY_DN73145_c0_g1_i1:222-1073(-)
MEAHALEEPRCGLVATDGPGPRLLSTPPSRQGGTGSSCQVWPMPSLSRSPWPPAATIPFGSPKELASPTGARHLLNTTPGRGSTTVGSDAFNQISVTRHPVHAHTVSNAPPLSAWTVRGGSTPNLIDGKATLGKRAAALHCETLMTEGISSPHLAEWFRPPASGRTTVELDQPPATKYLSHIRYHGMPRAWRGPEDGMVLLTYSGGARIPSTLSGPLAPGSPQSKQQKHRLGPWFSSERLFTQGHSKNVGSREPSFRRITRPGANDTKASSHGFSHTKVSTEA